MKWAIVDEHGIVVGFGEAPNGAKLKSNMIKVSVDVDIDKHYIEGGKVKEISKQPTEFHVLDRKSKKWVKDNSLLAKSIREKRNSLIGETDWTQLPDISSDVRRKWAAYRKELRDLTNQAGFPESVVWPDKPL